MISAELLRAATGCTAGAAEIYAEHLSAACARYGIDRTPQRLAAFLAQVGHESGSLRHAREVWGPTPAQQRYEGRRDLGNSQPGDGALYRGRGLIQITGRANYRAAAERMRALGAPDFEADPSALESPRWAAWSAAEWWSAHGCNELADRGDFEALTRRINGGVNGLDDRRKRWERAQAALAITTSTTPENAPSGPPGAAQGLPEGDHSMPLSAFVAAALPLIVDQIPKLAKVFGSGSAVAERNVKAAELVVGAVKDAVGAATEQEAVERMRSDPAARQAAERAVEARWYEIAEAGGGGIDGARKADAAAVDGGRRPWQSPSMWALLLLLPMAYMVVGSVVGLWGAADWSPDVRAAIATAVVSLVIGGAAGYYWGASTTRNRPTT